MLSIRLWPRHPPVSTDLQRLGVDHILTYPDWTEMSRVNQRVEEWKRKVVDLSRRNRLLYFARSRGSSIKITEPLLPVVFDRLVKAERACPFGKAA